MVGRCVAYGCKNTVSSNISLHVFPKDPKYRLMWQRNVQRHRKHWKASSRSLLCSEHFEKNDQNFHTEDLTRTLLGLPRKSRIVLKPTAVPTIFKNFVKKPRVHQATEKRQRKRFGEDLLQNAGNKDLSVATNENCCPEPPSTKCQVKMKQEITNIEHEANEPNNIIEVSADQFNGNSKCCCVTGCKSKLDKKNNISIHTFPKNEQLRKKWQVALQIQRHINNKMYVCSKHFLTTDFTISDYQVRILKYDAIPSQNIPENETKPSVLEETEQAMTLNNCCEKTQGLSLMLTGLGSIGGMLSWQNGSPCYLLDPNLNFSTSTQYGNFIGDCSAIKNDCEKSINDMEGLCSSYQKCKKDLSTSIDYADFNIDSSDIKTAYLEPEVCLDVIQPSEQTHSSAALVSDERPPLMFLPRNADTHFKMPINDCIKVERDNYMGMSCSISREAVLNSDQYILPHDLAHITSES